MHTADPTLIGAAMDVSGNLLYALTAMIIVFGLLVVASSFRRSPEK